MTKSFFISYNPHAHGSHLDIYPTTHQPQIITHYEKYRESILSSESERSSQSNFIDRQKYISYRDMIKQAPETLDINSDTWTLLSNFFNSYIAFYLNSKNEICGIQRTPSFGERHVFKIDYEEGDTTFVNPVDNSNINIPEEILLWHSSEDMSTVIQTPVWGWYNEPVYSISISGVRRINEDNFTPYSDENNALIESKFEELSAENPKIEFTVGIIDLTLEIINGVPNQILVQKHGKRSHFAKRKLLTEKEVQTYKEKLQENYDTVCDGAVGDIINCAICMNLLKGQICIQLPCKHVFHGLCAQTHATFNDATCPVCRTPSNINIDGCNSNSTLIFGGR